MHNSMMHQGIEYNRCKSNIFANHPKFIIAKMDVCANEVKEVKISIYPTVKLFKFGTNKS